jgi:hypothetical protein
VAQRDSPETHQTPSFSSGEEERPRARHKHGRAKRPNKKTKCLAERNEKRRTVLASAASSTATNKEPSTSTPEYIPVCRKDGGYAAVQCHPSTRSCWCVTPTGRPIPGSSVLQVGPHASRPNCSKYRKRGKSTTQRRSSLAKNNRNCTLKPNSKN